MRNKLGPNKYTPDRPSYHYFDEQPDTLYWHNRYGDPRITLTLLLVFLISGALVAGAVGLSRSVKAKRAAANALPPVITLIDENGTRTVLSLDAPVEMICPAQSGEAASSEPQPTWTIPPAPNAHDFPLAALDAGIGGAASVTCLAMPDGRVRDCRVTTETPAGYGFGESAINIVQRGCLTRFSEELSPAEFTVRVPFNIY